MLIVPFTLFRGKVKDPTLPADHYYIIKGSTDTASEGDINTLTVAAYREWKGKTPNSYLTDFFGVNIPSSFSQIFHATDTGKANIMTALIMMKNLIIYS